MPTSHVPIAPAAPEPPSFRELGDAVGGLGAHAGDDLQPSVVEALDLLALAIDSLPHTAATATTEIHDLATRIAGADRGGASADLQTAFGLIGRELDAITPPTTRRTPYQHTLAALRAAVAKLRPQGNLVDEVGAIRDAFRAATDGVRIAADLPSWYGTAREPVTALPFVDARTAAETALLSFADASWSKAFVPGAHALASLADLLDASRDCGDTGAVTTQTTEMRFQAALLRHSNTLSGSRGIVFKRALTAAIDALGILTPKVPHGFGIAAAARAVAAIDDHATLAFSRAPIQDALRAVLDATVATCPQVP